MGGGGGGGLGMFFHGITQNIVYRVSVTKKMHNLQLFTNTVLRSTHGFCLNWMTAPNIPSP